MVVSTCIELNLETIQRIENRDLIKKLAGDLCVGPFTIRDWKRMRYKIQKWCAVKANCSSQKTKKK